MGPAELKTIRESLGLSARWLADRAGVLQRSVQYWEAAAAAVPEDVADLILRIDAQFTESDAAGAGGGRRADGQAGPPARNRAAVPLSGRRRALHAARPDMSGLPVTAHAALLARVRLALLARGRRWQLVRLISA